MGLQFFNSFGALSFFGIKEMIPLLWVMASFSFLFQLKTLAFFLIHFVEFVGFTAEKSFSQIVTTKFVFICFLKCFSNLVTRVNVQNQRKYTKTNATTKQLTKTISVHRTFSSDGGHVTKKGGKTKTGNPANTPTLLFCYFGTLDCVKITNI